MGATTIPGAQGAAPFGAAGQAPLAPSSEPFAPAQQSAGGGGYSGNGGCGVHGPSGPVGPTGGFGPTGPVGPVGPMTQAWPPRRPRFRREQKVAALLASAGVGVTLIGVVLLLTIVAREGLLTPAVRVAGGAVLAAALAGAALWVRPRTGGRIGSVALLATGVAGAYFDVVAVTRFYSWVPLVVGLVIAFALASLAALQAIRWEEKWLFLAVLTGVAVLAPCLTQGVTPALVAFLGVLQVAGIAPEIAKNWEQTAFARTAPVALAAIALGWSADERVAAFTAGSIAAIGLLSGLLTGLTRRDTGWASTALAFSWLPVWVFAVTSPRLTWAIVSGAMTLAAFGGCLVLRRTTSLTRLTVAALAGLSALTCAVACASGDWRALPLLTITVAALVLHTRDQRSVVTAIALVSLALAVVTQATATSYVDLFYASRVAAMPLSVPVVGAVFMLVAALGVAAVRGRGLPAERVQIVLGSTGAAGLLGMTMTVLTLAGGTRTGFFVAHLAVTVILLGVAAVVLNAGLTHHRHLAASLGWGLTLIAAALAKLVLFDLAYMGLAIRALTCMAAGIVLLAAGTVYARTYATVAAQRDAAADANGAGAQGLDTTPATPTMN